MVKRKLFFHIFNLLAVKCEIEKETKKHLYLLSVHVFLPSLTNRYINKVTVQDLQTRQVWQFLCGCWLSVDRGDGMTKKTFNAAKNNEIASFRWGCDLFFHFFQL